MQTVEVFAEITCPFTHVGLKQMMARIREMHEPVEVIVRAWPLEWVNGAPLEVAAVVAKSRALSEQLGIDDFAGLRVDRWPVSTIPALNLAASAYRRDASAGLEVSLELRAALFERGEDVGDAEVLARIAAAHDLPEPGDEACDSIRADYDDGRRRGVKGSPHFFVGTDNFFCPVLDLGHDSDGRLTARFDTDRFTDFLACLRP